jgi:hypothetical protein
MEEHYRIGWHVKVLSNLIKREVGNYCCEKCSDELTGNNMFIIGYLAKNGEKDVFQNAVSCPECGQLLDFLDAIPLIEKEMEKCINESYLGLL